MGANCSCLQSTLDAGESSNISAGSKTQVDESAIRYGEDKTNAEPQVEAVTRHENENLLVADQAVMPDEKSNDENENLLVADKAIMLNEKSNDYNEEEGDSLYSSGEEALLEDEGEFDPERHISMILSKYEDMIPELKECFMQVLSGNAQKIEKIEIKNKSLGKMGDQMLCLLFSQLPKLKELSLINNKLDIMSAGFIIGCIAEAINLTDLSIADNQLGCHFAEMLEGFGVYEIQKLNLQGNKLSHKSVRHLASLLTEAINLGVLNIRNNNLKSKEIKILAKALYYTDTLKEFYFDEVKEKDFQKIQGYLSGASLFPTKIEKNEYSGNNEEDSSISEMSEEEEEGSEDEEDPIAIPMLNRRFSKYEAKMLPELKDYFIQVLNGNGKQIKNVKIENQKLNFRDSKLLGLLLARLPGLEELTLTNNKFSEKVMPCILECIRNLKNLVTLTVTNNQLRDQDVCDVAEFIHSDNLQNLSFEGNNITDEFPDGFVESIMLMDNLKSLSVKNNSMSSTGIMKLAEALRFSKYLKKFYFDEVEGEYLNEKIQGCLPNALLNPNQ